MVRKKDIQPNISLQHGMLVFKDQNSYDNTIKYLAGLSREQADNWEAQFKGFQSQRFIFEKAIDEDWKYYQALKEQVDKGLRTIEGILASEEEFSPYVQQHTELFNFSNDGTFNLKIENYDPFIQYVVNREGLIKIGSSIKQYSDGTIKVILDGDFHKISSLKNCLENDEYSQIQIYNVKTKVIENKDARFSGSESCTGYTSGGGQRVKGYTVLGQSTTIDVYGVHGYPGQVVSSPYAYLKAVNEYKGLFGWKTKRTTQLQIIGNNISYAIGGFHGNNINFIQGTNGELKTSITRYVFSTNNYYPGTTWVPFLFEGDATFIGRDNATCRL